MPKHAGYEERTKVLTGKLEEQLTQFANQDEFKRYLTFMASMRQYSVDNQILIYLQNPKARYVAGFQAWKKHERFVQRGEKGIQVRAPIFEQQPVVDPETKKPVYQNGIPQMETVLVRYKWVTVFDIAQTDGKQLKVTEDFVNDRFQTDAEAKDLYARLKAHLNTFKELHVAEKAYSIQDEGRGYFLPETNEIMINASEENPVAKLSTLVHEFAHAQLHGQHGHYQEVPRAHKEAQAESVACATMAYLGFDTSHFSLGYIATWAQDTDVMRQALVEIQATLEKTLATLDVVIRPDLHAALERSSQEMEQPIKEVSVAHLTTQLPALADVKGATCAVEVFDARYNGFEIAQYNRETQRLVDERGEVIDEVMLRDGVIVPLNIIDHLPSVVRAYQSFSNQFALRDVQTEAPRIELYHKKTNEAFGTFTDVREAKAIFLNAAAVENETVQAYVNAKEELAPFQSIVDRERARIERIEDRAQTKSFDEPAEPFHEKVHETKLSADF